MQVSVNGIFNKDSIVLTVVIKNVI